MSSKSVISVIREHLPPAEFKQFQQLCGSFMKGELCAGRFLNFAVGFVAEDMVADLVASLPNEARRREFHDTLEAMRVARSIIHPVGVWTSSGRSKRRARKQREPAVPASTATAGAKEPSISGLLESKDPSPEKQEASEDLNESNDLELSPNELECPVSACAN